MNLPDFKMPWVPIDQAFAEGAERTLRTEVGPRHVLKNRKVRAVAWRSGSDDVLFLLEDTPPMCAEVHLTRSGKVEPVPQVPTTAIFPSIHDWVAKSMTPDSEDWLAGEENETGA
jgi:hypothetical protein